MKALNKRKGNSNMQWNKTKTGLLIALGLVGGTAGVVGLQARAQQVQQPTQAAQVQPVAAQTNTSQTNQDTDNIQDPGGTEQLDIVGKQDDKEIDDDKNEVNDNEQNERAENPADDLLERAGLGK